MIPERRGPIPEKTLQEYLRALEENAGLAPQEREESCCAPTPSCNLACGEARAASAALTSAMRCR
jgi:hypothetical protein